MTNLKTAGRPTKYNTPETLSKLKHLVEMYKEENPFCGIIRVADMVRFSKHKNELDNANYPFYNKDVWRTYGIPFIDEVNQPMSSNLLSDATQNYNIPNVTDIVQRHGKNQIRLIEHLRPLEMMLHESLSKELQLRQEKSDLQSTIKSLRETILFYEQYVLQMAHHSLSQEYQEKYGLINQISINTNARNQNAMKNLDAWLNSSFGENENNVHQQPNKESRGLALWKEKKR